MLQKVEKKKLKYLAGKIKGIKVEKKVQNFKGISQESMLKSLSENKELRFRLASLCISKDLKKEICVNNRSFLLKKNNLKTKNTKNYQLSSVKKYRIKFFTKIQKSFLAENFIRKFSKKKTFLDKNDKKILIFWKAKKILGWTKKKTTTKGLKYKLLETLFKNIFGRPRLSKKNKKLFLKKEQKLFKKKFRLVNQSAYKSTKQNYLNFFSKFYGSVLFSNKKTDTLNFAFKKYAKNYNKLKFFRKAFRHDIFSQLAEKDNRFVSDNFKYRNLHKVLGEDWFFRKINPWFSGLVYKRDLYRGSVQPFNRYTNTKYIKWKYYLRYKNPRREKKNKLYNRYLYLLPSQKNSVIQISKKAYIKKTISKLLLPFYGHLTEKQFEKIVKKNRKVKSSVQTRQDIFLSRFERRLDVVVFRLNLAPNILWARRMILSGNIFVTNREDIKPLFELQGVKKNSFPLKLRDPKNLYKKNGFRYFGKKFKNFLFPKMNPSFLVSVGDLIQCSSMALVQSIFKTNKYLFKKPIPKHLLTVKSGIMKWNRYYAPYVGKNVWDQNFYQPTSAVVLFKPKVNDVYYRDRSNESFLKWITL